jgi:hypothetical protein
MIQRKAGSQNDPHDAAQKYLGGMKLGTVYPKVPRNINWFSSQTGPLGIEVHTIDTNSG